MRFSIIISIILVLFTVGGCTSVNGDAEKAADLKKKSEEYIKENNLEKAEQLFNESQAIIDKYVNTDDYDDFYNRFLEYSASNSEKK